MTDGREAAREPGELVRDVWVAWAREQPDVADHASWTVAWEALSARDREVDARIEATIRRDERERAGESALRAAAREVMKSYEAYVALGSARGIDSAGSPPKPEDQWDEYDYMMIPAWRRLKSALDGAPWGPSNEMVEREEARPMLTVDDRCKSPGCTQKDIYRMVGKCANCNAEPVLVLFTVGHEARQVSCPSCGVERVYTTRLATPEEIPVA